MVKIPVDELCTPEPEVEPSDNADGTSNVAMVFPELPSDGVEVYEEALTACVLGGLHGMVEDVSKGRGTDADFEARKKSVPTDKGIVWDGEVEYEHIEVKNDPRPDDNDDDDLVVSVSSLSCRTLLDAEVDDGAATTEGLKTALGKLLSGLSANGVLEMGVE